MDDIRPSGTDMRYDLKLRRLVAKEEKEIMIEREIETVVIVRETCEQCEGTGLLHMEEHTFDCDKCNGHGMVQVSRKKTIEREDLHE